MKHFLEPVPQSSDDVRLYLNVMRSAARDRKHHAPVTTFRPHFVHRILQLRAALRPRPADPVSVPQ